MCNKCFVCDVLNSLFVHFLCRILWISFSQSTLPFSSLLITVFLCIVLKYISLTSAKLESLLYNPNPTLITLTPKSERANIMRLQLFVLPAVLLEVATARVIRSPYQYASTSPSEAHLTPDSPGLHARFHNSSSTPEATLQSSTLSPSPEPSFLPLKAAQTPSEYGQSQSAVPTSGQVGSVPAFGSGPGAATTEESKSTTPTTQPHSSSFQQSYQKDTVAQTEAATSTQSSEQVSPSAAASSVQQTAGSSNTQAVSAQTSAVQKSVAATSVSSATTSAKGSAVGAGSQQPTGAASNSSSSTSGNTAMALGFNSIWASMGESSPCDANDKNQVVACIKGQYAQCSGGKYTMTPCPQGQQCFALPLSKDFKGVTVQCASLQEANQRLGQSSASPAAAAPTKSSSVKPQQTSAATPTQSPSATPQQISDAKSISTTTTTAPGSAKATPTAQQPTAVQSSKVSTTEVGSLPTATPTEPDSTITTKEPTSTNVTPTASAQHSGTAGPNVPSSKPTASSAAASATTDDIIIITPIADPTRR